MTFPQMKTKSREIKLLCNQSSFKLSYLSIESFIKGDPTIEIENLKNDLSNQRRNFQKIGEAESVDGYDQDVEMTEDS